MVRMPTSMPKSHVSKEGQAKEAANKAADELIAEAEQLRNTNPNDLKKRGQRTLEQLQEDARNLGDYARDKMEHMNEVMRDAAESARKSTGLPSSAPVPTDAMSDSVMDSLKTASDKLSAEISELGARVDSVRARVAQTVQTAGGKAADTWQAAGGKAADTWHQSSEAAKNVGEREYCLPLPTDRICARHVVFFAVPLLALLVLLMLRRQYPKKWSASVNKMKQPRKMMARDAPSTEKMQSHAEGAADTVEQKVDYAKQRGSGLIGEARDKYASKKDQ